MALILAEQQELPGGDVCENVGVTDATTY